MLLIADNWTSFITITKLETVLIVTIYFNKIYSEIT